ncbi:MAG: 2-oxoacid:ferredoxin oxidoreductase subunit beta [Thermoproteota archaeon]
MGVKSLELSDYKTDTTPTWCPGCGDFAVLRGIHGALAKLNINPKDVVVLSGIGCSSNITGFINSYGFHGLHGRALPVASGIKLANPELKVIASGGDGDGYGIGLGHFIHSMRRNIDITYVVMNNQVYGLTTGQASPTSEKGMITKSTNTGVLEIPVNPIALGLVSGATYIARGFSGDASQLTNLIEQGIQHKGFALVDVMSPCVTYNKINTYEWFRERVYRLEDENHNVINMEEAIRKSQEWDSKIPTGTFYKINRPTYESEQPALKEGNLVSRDINTGKQIAKDIFAEFI